MGRTGPPTTLVICCSLPTGMPSAAADACLESCLESGRRSAVPLTWIASIDRLPLVVRHSGVGAQRSAVALEIPATLSRQELRQLLARAAVEAPGIDAAAVRGPLSPEHRRLLVDGGIRVVCRERFDDVARGSRRPAPSGWPCRNTLWGLWEVTESTALPPSLASRLLAWGSHRGPLPGTLAVLDVGGQGPFPDPATIRGRIEQWWNWAERQNRPGQAVFATLADLPALITGAGRLPVGGSVFKVA